MHCIVHSSADFGRGGVVIFVEKFTPASPIRRFLSDNGPDGSHIAERIRLIRVCEKEAWLLQ